MRRLRSIAALFVFCLLGGCSSSQSNATDGVTRLSPEAFLEQREADAVVLDVRTPEEFATGHLKDAQNIDVRAADFNSVVDALDRSKTYYLYCRSGNRSGRAAGIMKEMGFEMLYNIGGYSALADAGAETTQ